MKKISVVKYKTINSCLAAFFTCEPKELDSVEGEWRWMASDGVEESCSNVSALKEIRKRDVWAWVENKEIIHIFVRKTADLRHIIHAFAHELGHQQRPYHRTIKEEQKACIYAEIACGAYDLATEIFKEGGTT